MKLKPIVLGVVGVAGGLYAVSRLAPLAIDRAFSKQSPRDLTVALRSRLPFGGNSAADWVDDATKNGDDSGLRGLRQDSPADQS